MELIKKISSKKYIGKDGKEYFYKSYILRFDNGKECPIAPAIYGKDDKSIKWRNDLYVLLDNLSKIEQ